MITIILFGACRSDQESEPEDFGFLSTTISVEITEEEANARTEAVNTDDFVLIIYDAGDNVAMTFDPFSTAPSEVQLPVGEYYVVANSNDLVEAGFDNPYYFGRSANFTIDKEETKTVDIIATLANAKVAINYSADVVNTFDVYEGVVTITGSGTTLTYMTGETREGYFVTSSPLDVEVSLVYTKLDGTTIERSLTATISDPQSKTLYNINVDAVLEEGSIIFNLTVDESFDTVDIQLGATANFEGCRLAGFEVLEDGSVQQWNFELSSEGLVDEITYSDNDSESFSYSLTFDSSGDLIMAEGDENYQKREVFIYNAQDQLIRREEFRDNGIGFELYRINNFIYSLHEQLAQREEYDTNPDGSLGPLENIWRYYYTDTETKNSYRVERYNSSVIVDRVVYYTYDNQPNPLLQSGIWACDDCIDTDLFAFGENNITQVLWYNSDETQLVLTISSTYSYNTDGYPTSVDFMSVDDGGEIDGYTQNYDYQCN